MTGRTRHRRPVWIVEPDPVPWTPRSTKSVIHGRLVRSLATNRNLTAVGNAVPLIAPTPVALGLLTWRGSTWQARAEGKQTILKGEQVKIIGRNNITWIVQKT